MMRRAYGLTLIEVLASTALLTILAATCVPLLRRSLRVIRAPAPPLELFELAEFADTFVADPAAFEPGVEEIHREVPWPDAPDLPPVSVWSMTAADDEADHVWLVFTCERWTVARWRPLDGEDETGGEADEHEGGP